MAKPMSRPERLADEETADRETDDELIAKYIVRNPDAMGPDRAMNTWGASVWALIG